MKPNFKYLIGFSLLLILFISWFRANDNINFEFVVGIAGDKIQPLLKSYSEYTTLKVKQKQILFPKLNGNISFYNGDSIFTEKNRDENLTCNRNITLQEFNSSYSEKLQVFFLETSGKTYLSGRQSCSIESAALQSGLVSKVILRSSILDLSKSTSVCRLYYYYKNVEFYTINFSKLFENTPVVGIEKKIDKVVSHGITHYSSISRKALVYKYGGWYLDLDIVVLKDLAQLTNFYALEPEKAHG